MFLFDTTKMMLNGQWDPNIRHLAQFERTVRLENRNGNNKPESERVGFWDTVGTSKDVPIRELRNNCYPTK